MTIPKDKMKAIEELRERGDAPKLAKLAGVAESTMYLILNKGVCSPAVAATIMRFYAIRKKERREISKMLPKE